jgi:AmmeMemoRadiSam system protein A
MSPQSEKSEVRPAANTGVHNLDIHRGNEFSPDERKQLLALAHEAILSAIEHREIPQTAPSVRFAAPRGAFTTIYLHKNLRGCVGYAFPIAPLYRTIIETARGAAFEDTRFLPVTLAEAQQLEVSLSILSPLKAVRAQEVEIGTHGVLISQHGRRGLLLPQVPLEHGWDRNTFLEETCRKAGLPLDGWRTGAKIEVFTAEIFGDSDPR